jgi:hypothetical protein
VIMVAVFPSWQSEFKRLVPRMEPRDSINTEFCASLRMIFPVQRSLA